MKRKILSVLAVGTIGFSSLLSPVLSIGAAPSTVAGFDQLISELKSEENELSAQITALQEKMKQNEAESDQLVAEMTATENTLTELRTEIEALKVVIAERELLLDEQARALQIVGESGNVVNFVLQAETLSEMVGRADVVNKVISFNKQTIDQQEADKAMVETKEKETVQKQEEQNKLAGKLETNKALLEEQKAEQESVLAKVAAEKSNAQSERSQLIAQAKEAEQRRAALAAVRTGNFDTVSNSSANSTFANSSAVQKDVTTSTNAVAPSPAPAPSPAGGSVISIATSLQGIPYRTAGSTTAGFDCSGFTTYVFNQTGRSLPRTAAGQYAGTSRVSRSQAQPGDLVFFKQGGGVDHVGIYLGGGRFIGSQTSTGVSTATLDSGYWAKYVVGFGR